MYKGQHYKFITTPLSKILEDGVNASRGIGSGIETYPLCDYIMQSIFLKMTGAQEQKMKCICWEMATNDYKYRYEYLNNKKYSSHECSTIDDKEAIYSDLIKEILKRSNYDLSRMDKSRIIREAQDKVKTIFNDKNLSTYQQKEYNCFINTALCQSLIPTQTKIFGKCDNCSDYDKTNKNCQRNTVSLATLFDFMHDHRNRCAHNLTSYQQDLPTLSTLANPDYIYHNYFFRFAILILIDEIFICLYKKYVEALENNINW